MRKHYPATWLLNRFLSRTDAEAVLGDLLEESGASASRFRRLLLGTLWSLGWRSCAAYVTSAVVGALALMLLQTAFFGSLSVHAPSLWQRTWGSTLAFEAGCLCLVTCFSALRYGLLDKMTELAFALAAIGLLAVLFWWVRDVPVIASVCFLVLVVVSLRTASNWAALTATAILLVLQPLLWFGGLTVVVSLLALALKHRHVEMGTANPWIGCWLIVSYLGLAMLSCFASAKVHRWMRVTAAA